MIILCALLLDITGATLIYMSHRQQRLLARPLHKSLLLAAFGLVIAGLLAWTYGAGTAAGIAAALTTLMLTWVLLPYLAWWGAPAQPAQAGER